MGKGRGKKKGRKLCAPGAIQQDQAMFHVVPTSGRADKKVVEEPVAMNLKLQTKEKQQMAASMNISASSLIPNRALLSPKQNQHHSFINLQGNSSDRLSRSRTSFRVRAAKLPSGVELPKVQPKFQAPFAGFTRTAEIWNSRACMIGLIGTFIVELALFFLWYAHQIINRGILEVIGVEIGKGLDIPL